MSNDPDLLDHLSQTCPECDGDGGWMEDDGSPAGSVYVDCAACGGSGVQ